MDDDQRREYVKVAAEAAIANREFARLAIEQAADMAEDRIKRGVYKNNNEAATLRGHIDVARDEFRAVERCLTMLAGDRQHLTVLGWRAVGLLAEAMYQIGGLMEVSEAADENVLRVENKIRRPARRRAKKKEKLDGPRTAALDAVILACVDGDRSKLSSYVDKPNPAYEDVRELMPKQFLRGKWPKPSTVRNRIMALKKIGSL
jgi:hypothetical protein